MMYIVHFRSISNYNTKQFPLFICCIPEERASQQEHSQDEPFISKRFRGSFSKKPNQNKNTDQLPDKVCIHSGYKQVNINMVQLIVVYQIKLNGFVS